nr:C751 [uncultured bacterium]ART39704.1 J106 [uncultured bacterium]
MMKHDVQCLKLYGFLSLKTSKVIITNAPNSHRALGINFYENLITYFSV